LSPKDRARDVSRKIPFFVRFSKESMGLSSVGWLQAALLS
jgi:hypothetical protein